MKSMKCDRCDHIAEGATFEDWMNALKPHYGMMHAEVMTQHSGASKEEQMAKMQEWMDENRARFDAI